MIQDPAELGALLEAIMADYDEHEAFFATHRLPEYVVLEQLDLTGRDRALFLTLTCVTNHIHDDTGESKQTAGENGLWAVCANLWDQHRWVFRPEELVGENRKEALRTLFERLELMDQRDPEWWFRNAKTLHEQWDDDPRSLLETPSRTASGVDTPRYDAPSIERTIRAGDFPALGGEKIRPLWLRLMHEEVHPLQRIAKIQIPVDFHIVKVTNRLRGNGEQFNRYDDRDKETLRTFWQVTCEQHDLIPVVVDKPLWLLHKYWNEGGRKYIAGTLGAIRDHRR